MNEYMYVWIRRDLSIPQQIVQASHASAVIGNKYHDRTNIVLCGTSDEADLCNVSAFLNSHSIDHELFYEPDIEGHTAIATEPLSMDRRKVMRKFSLFK